jgi:hypothetical protein
MTIKKLWALMGGVGCVAALQGCAVGADGAEGTEESIATVDSNIASSITITGDWGGVYCANVTVANNLAVAGNSWKVVLDMKGSSIQYVNGNKNVWNAVAGGNSGYVTFSPQSYNTYISPGQSTSFGFCATAPSGTARATMAGYNMTTTSYAACDSNSGVNPTRAALAVAMGTELGRWKPEVDLMIAWDGKVALTSSGLAMCTNGCSNTKAILAMQDNVFSSLLGQEVFNATVYREDLKASFGRHYGKIDDLTRNNPGALPPPHKLTLVGGPTNFGNGSCGPHYIYKATDLNGNPLTSAQASNLANALCFFGQGSCGFNPYIGFINNAQGCPSGQTCIAIDPSDGTNSSTTTSSAGTAVTYPMNKVKYDSALVNASCMTTGGKLGKLLDKCSTQPATCGWLICTAI